MEPQQRRPRWISYAAAPGAPPPAGGAHLDRVLYGLMQPLLGARMLLRHPELRRAALVPALLLAGFCALVALLGTIGEPPLSVFRRFYEVFALLAPLPSVLLAGHYARLAVLARDKLGLGASSACVEPLWRAAKRAIFQAILIAIALAPATLLLHLVPVAGAVLVKVVAALWALHWIVIDAFDSARTLAPGETVVGMHARALTAPCPWFVRIMQGVGERLPLVGRLLRWFARRCDRMALPWREEMALIERHLSLAAGFALATAALLAIPGLNLLFRPIVLIGAVHVAGRLEGEG